LTDITIATGNKFAATGAKILEEQIRTISKPIVNFAFCGGRSVSGIFAELLKNNINWTRIHFYLVDERMVQPDHKDSNYKLAYDTFLSKLLEDGKITDNQLHPFRMDEGLDSYEKNLVDHGGCYDIVLLSAGEDGHIGALYPNHHSIEDDSMFYIEMQDSPKPPPDRMSMSRKLLLASGFALLLFLGNGKMPALEKYKDPAVEYKECPAKLVKYIDHAVITDLEV